MSKADLAALLQKLTLQTQRRLADAPEGSED